MSAPFRVRYHRNGCSGPEWSLWSRHPERFLGWFETQAEAIDHAYRDWPWWP